MDYATITAEVTDYEHEDARKLRSAVRKWAESFDNTEDRMAIWLEGWKEGFEVSRKKRRSKSSSREKSVGRTEKSKKTGSSDYSREEFGDDSVDRDGNLGDSDRRKVYHGTCDKRVVEKRQKHGNSQGNKSTESYDRERRENGRQLKSVSEQGRDNRESGDRRREKDRKSRDNERSISRGQAINDKTESESDKKRQGNSDAKSKDERREKDRNRRELSETETPGEEPRKEKEPILNELVKEKQTDNDKAINKDSETDTLTTMNQTEAKECEISEEPKTNTTVKRKNIEISSCETPTKTKRIEDGLDSYVDNIELMEEGTVDESIVLEEKEDRVERDTADTSSSSSSSDSSSTASSASSDITPTADSKSLRARALTILSRGAMPLCPPARRIWSRTLQIELNEKVISWPPSNWRALSPELRLFAMEQMALTLERGSCEEFPKLPKKLLVDKYMFLMLEGQDKPLPGQTEEEKVFDKIRQYNLNFLRGIVRGDISDSRQSWSIIKTLERADRWTDTDEILNYLESKNIKIKV